MGDLKKRYAEQSLTRKRRADKLRRIRQLRDKAVEWSNEFRPLFLAKIMAGERSNAFLELCYEIAEDAYREERNRWISGAPTPWEPYMLFGVTAFDNQ